MIRCEDMHDFDEAVKLRDASKKWPRAVGWACAVFVLLLSDILFVKGYCFGEGDHTFYVPQLQAGAHSSLYPNSSAITRITNQFSFFNKDESTFFLDQSSNKSTVC